MKDFKVITHKPADDDPVNHPCHYTYGRVETIDFIEDCLEGCGLISYCIGNVIKYISRAEHKGNFLEDVKKAQWYLNKAVETAEKEYALYEENPNKVSDLNFA